MEIQDFAEKVLFTDNLEEKLTFPSVIHDTPSRPSIVSPDSPGRPVDLKFKGRQDPSVQFPKADNLGKESNRAILLHFLANHELLAVELMALALLKFPDAPAEFRAGLVRTLRDEQIHTRMYMSRLQDWGIKFGSISVNRSFWAMVAPMTTPLDYVSRLSLTFEQANLDYTRFYANCFSRLEDLKTSRLLEKVHQDEIGHVRYGLKWFRKWKNSSHDDWHAYERQLLYPLSPRRAKGLFFNRQSRIEAGLEKTYIDELEVFSQSKGRPPTVFHLNLFAEEFVASDGKFQPNKQQKNQLRDLGSLAQFLSRQDDVVLLHQLPDKSFLRKLCQLGIQLPQFKTIDSLTSKESTSFKDRRFNRIRPWAWSPESYSLFDPLFTHCNHPPEPSTWNVIQKKLFAKESGCNVLLQWLENQEHNPSFCPVEVVGKRATSEKQALEIIQDYRREGWSKLVVKQDFGMAGKHMIRLWEPELLPAQIQWIRRTLQSEIPVIIEPWLTRVLDFSAQWDFGPEGMRWRGLTRNHIDNRGLFKGIIVQKNFGNGLSSELKRFLLSQGQKKGWFFEMLNDLKPTLEDHLGKLNHEGPVGIDGFVYLDQENRFRIKPIVEINARFTMGRMALELKRIVQFGKRFYFGILSRNRIQKLGYSDFSEFVAIQENKFPIELASDAAGRILKGFLPLNSPSQAVASLAFLQVNGDLQELLPEFNHRV
ncbi:MAG TPA: DUF455 family protein [Verrucomicrobiales bacterium]|nr:DUF455 family protein [Verrucomicrobiales bacterium]HIL68624.1 DUF455 family protein [Verrucomicrobiota bacterium]